MYNFDKLTAYLDSLEEHYGVPAADCIITKEHEVIYRHTVGHADHERNIPLSGSEYYYLFSATKVITMTAAMQLIEQGKLSLDDDVSKYLPEFADIRVSDREFPMSLFPAEGPESTHPAKNPIRIVDLMAMMGGLTYDIGSPEIKALAEESGGKAGTVEMMKAIAKMPLAFEPGSHWNYSLCHDVMGAVIEVVSGQPFGAYLKAHIFDPLGAEHIRFTDDSIKAAAMYTWTGDNTVEPIPQSNMFRLTENYESGGAGLMSTVESYSKIVDALANYGLGANGARILSEDSVKLFMQGVTEGAALDDYQARFNAPEYRYGHGVRVKCSTERGRAPVGEFGWDGAAGANSVIDPINRVSVFYAQHVMNHGPVYSEIHPAIRELAYEGLGI